MSQTTETDELEIELYIFISDYLEHNMIEYHDPSFHDNLVNLATNEYFEMCISINIYETIDDYEDAYASIHHKIDKLVREYLKWLNITIFS